jgi:uncharacterized SAM-binding protein YcdF (DUF218 family)
LRDKSAANFLMLTSVARGLALFLGGFTLLNLAGDYRFAGASANSWWINVPLLPPLASKIFLAMLGIVLLAYAAAPNVGPQRRVVATVLLGVAVLSAFSNSISFYVMLAKGKIVSAVPIPLSIFIAATLVAIGIAHFRAPANRPWVALAAFVAATLTFPIAQISLFGVTDYRRPADLIVVFGARAYADGTLSNALADRVRTGSALFLAGLAPRLLFSGGPGDGAMNEPEAMRRFAHSLGVPDSAIMLDPHGINTEATVRNTISLMQNQPLRILTVSHFYHLPRIKMTFQRYGADVWTVPCDTSVLSETPFNLLREDAAFWAYYIRRLR